MGCENLRVTASSIGFSKGSVIESTCSYEDMVKEANTAVNQLKMDAEEYDPIMLYDYLCCMYGNTSDSVTLSTENRYKRNRYSVVAEYPRTAESLASDFIILVCRHGNGSVIIIDGSVLKNNQEANISLGVNDATSELEDVLSVKSDYFTSIG